jgi:sulfur relay (sulfurtransferase) DsrF/TusC family protein
MTQDRSHPSLRKVLDSMPLYDVDHLWVDLASLEQHGMDPVALPDYARGADNARLRDLIAHAGHVLSL